MWNKQLQLSNCTHKIPTVTEPKGKSVTFLIRHHTNYQHTYWVNGDEPRFCSWNGETVFISPHQECLIGLHSLIQKGLLRQSPSSRRWILTCTISSECTMIADELHISFFHTTHWIGSNVCQPFIRCCITHYIIGYNIFFCLIPDIYCVTCFFRFL